MIYVVSCSGHNAIDHRLSFSLMTLATGDLNCFFPPTLFNGRILHYRLAVEQFKIYGLKEASNSTLLLTIILTFRIHQIISGDTVPDCLIYFQVLVAGNC